MEYRVIRSFAHGNTVVTKGMKVDMPEVHAKPLIAKGLITSFYQNKSEKAVPELDNKAYIVPDKGQMFFVKREGEVIARHTKKKAIEVRDALNSTT